MQKYTPPRTATRGPSLPWLTAFLLAAVLTTSWPIAGQPAAGSAGVAPVLLRLRSGGYDPVRSASVASQSPASASRPAEASALYVVQFSGPIHAEWRRALAGSGATILEYLPDFAYLVRAPAATAARFAALPGHRWHGPFEGVRQRATAAGIAAVARRSHGLSPVLLNVMTFPGEDAAAVAGQIPGQVVQRSGRRRVFMRVSVPPSAAARVAAVPGVEWVEPYVRPVLFNDVAGGLMQVPAARDDAGLYGRGQVVAVADTGLDVGRLDTLSADFQGRVRRAYALSRSATGDWSDLQGHGTHVCGSVLGAGVLSGADPANHRYSGSFAGMAPEASLVIQSVGDAGDSLALPADLGQLLLPPYQNDGARIHSDSWGESDPSESGQYLQSSWQLDDICSQARDLVVVFAAGNEGVDADGNGVVDLNSLSPEAAAKNVISVGASESVRAQPMTWGRFPMFPSDPIWSSRLAGSPSGMAAFSSRGPTADGRIKPDLVAPGTWILSARSHAPGAGTLWGAYNADYAYSGGTSQSAPLVAGAAALVREGLQERYGIADPSSALIKAALMNGADELAPGQYGNGATREIPPRPNPVEGWGRVDVRQALGLPGSPAVVPVDEAVGLQTQEERRYQVVVVPGSGALRLTLAWTDPPASPLAGPQLVNDLDLKLLTPDGRWLLGNGMPDRANNVETIELDQPPAGVYTAVVQGYNVPQGPQPYGLVIAGPIQPPGATGLRVSLHSGSPALPIAGADLIVSGGRSLTLTSAVDGSLQAQLPAGSYTLSPSKPGWTFDPPSRALTIADGQMQAVDFTASAAPGALAGVVTGAGGAPLGGVAIALSPGGLSALTAADGSYRFPALPPLDYSVTPMLPGTSFAPGSLTARVTSGGVARADFAVATAALIGTVVGVGPAEAQPVASAHPVTLFGTQRWTVSRPGAHWIRLHFTRIDVQTGAEYVAVLDSLGRPVNRWSGPFSDTWSAWAPGSSLTIQYAASAFYKRYGFDVDLVQTDLGGTPLSNAAVALQPGGLATYTDSTGSFRFSGLSSGSFAVAPALSGWEFFPPSADITLPFGTTESSVTFLAQGPAGD